MQAQALVSTCFTRSTPPSPTSDRSRRRPIRRPGAECRPRETISQRPIRRRPRLRGHRVGRHDGRAPARMPTGKRPSARRTRVPDAPTAMLQCPNAGHRGVPQGPSSRTRLPTGIAAIDPLPRCTARAGGGRSPDCDGFPNQRRRPQAPVNPPIVGGVGGAGAAARAQGRRFSGQAGTRQPVASRTL